MTVEELIVELQKCNPKATVIKTSSNFELGGADVELKSIYATQTGSVRVKNCRDAFDGCNYTVDEWSTHGGELNVVKI